MHEDWLRSIFIMNHILISVIIPTFNKLSRLRLTLLSLEKQKFGMDSFEVVVIDDGSTDGTAQYCMEYKGRLNLRVFTISNSGRSTARNEGVYRSFGKWIIFVDDDLVLNDYFTYYHFKNLLSGKKIGIHGEIRELTYLKFFKDPVNGDLIEDYENNEINIKGLTKYLLNSAIVEAGDWKKLDRQSKSSHIEKIIKDILSNGYDQLSWLAMTGGNFSISKKLFLDAGGFDTGFGLRWGCEDFELGYRLYQKGVQFVYDGKCVNYHMTHVRRNIDSDIRNSLHLFYTKHQDKYVQQLYHLLLGEYKSVAKYMQYIESLGELYGK